jgi:uncharacterized membrane protein
VGLEVLVAADLIRTLAVQPTIENIGVLGQQDVPANRRFLTPERGVASLA